jgi:hypothetical protein
MEVENGQSIFVGRRYDERVGTTRHREILNLTCRQKPQRCIVSRTMLAPEGHCINLGTVTVVGANEPDVLDPICHRARTRGMFLTSYFTLPIFGRTLVASCLIDVGVAAKQLAIVQDQDAANFAVHTIAGSSDERIDSILNHALYPASEHHNR